jgi:hypothetical protein
VTVLSRSAAGAFRRHWVHRSLAARRGLAALPAWAAPVAVGAAALAWCAVAGLADPTRPGNVLPRCPFKMLTGWSCPGCGSTRMLHELLHGDIAGAARYNIVALLMTPVLVWSWVAWTAPRVGRRPPPTWRPSSRVQQAGLVAWLVFSVLRNLPWAPFSALHV